MACFHKKENSLKPIYPNNLPATIDKKKIRKKTECGI